MSLLKVMCGNLSYNSIFMGPILRIHINSVFSAELNLQSFWENVNFWWKICEAKNSSFYYKFYDAENSKFPVNFNVPNKIFSIFREVFINLAVILWFPVSTNELSAFQSSFPKFCITIYERLKTLIPH